MTPAALPPLVAVTLALGVAALGNITALVLAIPVLLVLTSYLGVLPPAFVLGDVEVGVHDLVLVAVLLRVGWRLALRRTALDRAGSLAAVGVFAVVLVLATAAAAFRFDAAVVTAELAPLARFLAVATVPVALASSLTSERELRRAVGEIGLLGVLTVGTVLWNVVFFRHHLAVGEVFNEGSVRYFGPMGDQVGFVLVFFCLWALVSQRWVLASLAAGAVIATGTRGALIALVVGVAAAVVVTLPEKVERWVRRLVVVLTATAVLAAVTISLDLGGMRTRVVEVGAQPGLSARQLVWGLAARMAWASPVIGYGYGGFRALNSEFGGVELFQENLYYADALVASTANQWLQTAVDAGALGVVMLAVLALAAARDLKRARTLAHGSLRAFFAAGLAWSVALFIGNQSATWMLPASMILYLFWLLLGVTAAAGRVLRQAQEVM